MKAIGLCIASGLLTSVSFSVENLWFLCFFSLMPMFFAIEKYSKKLKLRQWFGAFFAFGFSLYFTLMYWLFELTPVLQEQMSKISASLLILLAISLSSLFLGLFYSLGLTSICRIASNKNLDVIYFAFLYILGEFFTQCFTPLSFPWARLGAIVTPFTAFIQSANLFGSLFLSFLIVMINGFLCRAVMAIKAPKQCISSIAVAALIFGINTSYGTIRLENHKNNEEISSDNAVLVQGNISGLSKWQMTIEEIMAAYFEEALENIDENTKLVVFPETAAPFRYNENPEWADMLDSFADENDITLVTGVFYGENDGEKENLYNALICIEPEYVVSEPYYKQVLVPLGEYIPFADFLMQHFPEIFEIIGYVEPGDESGAISTQQAKIGGVICYESIYSSIVRSTVNDGAQIITIISNDSWFGESPALRQHHAHAILRAVENERYVLRASSTAITSAIDSHGNVLEVAPMLERSAIKVNYNLNSGKTLYSYVGDIILLPGFLLVAHSVYLTLKRRYSAKNQYADTHDNG